MLNKKIVFIGIGVIVLLGVIGGGYYWWTGTPEYSINQIKKAIETHNSELGLKYIDTDAIFENLWTDMKSELMKETEKAEGFEAFGMMLGVQLAESMKPVLKEQFRQGIESWFSAPTEGEPEETTSTKKASGLSTIWQKDLEIKKQGDSAHIELPDNVKVVLTQKEGERYWVVSEIKGFTDFFGGEETEQKTNKQGIVLPNRLKEKVDVELVDKDFISSDWERGIYDDYITMKLRFINKTNKDIKGVQGKVIFYDIFDNEIYRTKISYDEGIPKNESKVWSGQIEYNQFRDDHRKLRTTELENLKYEWLPDTIIYQDGSEETE